MTDVRRILSGICLGLGIIFTPLAFFFLSLPFIASITGTYEGGEQAIFAFFLYGLMNLPALLFCGLSIVIRGWREARAGYVTLGVLWGVPLLLLIAALVSAAFDSIRK